MRGWDDGRWPMRKLFSLVVNGAICCNNSESEEKERTLNAFPVRVRLMNPIYLEMQWKNKAPHRVQGSSVTQHWAASARGRELGRHSGGRGESASNFVKWWMSLGVNTRFPLQISISRVLTTHTDRLTAGLTARSEWGDFSGNARTGESLTHRETEMLVVVLTQIVPANQKPLVRPTDQWETFSETHWPMTHSGWPRAEWVFSETYWPMCSQDDPERNESDTLQTLSHWYEDPGPSRGSHWPLSEGNMETQQSLSSSAHYCEQPI